ncbi:hypothetical protein [Kitasatospora sp. NPDC090091]|uniref:hypothetical protein n=1 Tax=Kitasatospora sp. NPDC090091 TaxID=3364081 RepID=UPI0037FDB1C5
MSLPRPEPGPGSDSDRTARLGGGPLPERTVPLGRAAPAAEEAECATYLDPTVWGTATAGTAPAPPRHEPPQPEPPPHEPPPYEPPRYEVHRFGPGVPPVAAAVWHGPPSEPPLPPRRRRGVRWLLPAAVLIVLLAFLLVRCRAEPPLALGGVTVAAEPAGGPPCGGTAVITATVVTDGHAGTIRYRWLRSDGTSSGELVQPVQSGERRADLVLRWSFDGRGTMQATATVDILAPRHLGAATSFTYACQG